MSEIARMSLRFPPALAVSLVMFVALTGCGPAVESMGGPNVPGITVEGHRIATAQLLKGGTLTFIFYADA